MKHYHLDGPKAVCGAPILYVVTEKGRKECRNGSIFPENIACETCLAHIEARDRALAPLKGPFSLSGDLF